MPNTRRKPRLTAATECSNSDGNYNITHARWQLMLTAIAVLVALMGIVQAPATAQENREAIGKLGSPSSSIIKLGGQPYKHEIDELVQRGQAGALSVAPQLHIDNRSALLMEDGGRLTLGISLISDTSVTDGSGPEFLLVSDRGSITHVKTNMDKSSKQMRSLILQDLEGNGLELNRVESRMYRISANSTKETAKSASMGTVGCVKQALADALKPCEASILSGQMAACALLLANTPDTAGISTVFAIPACADAAQSITQTLLCSGIDCGLASANSPPPAISDANPKNIPVGQNTMLTIDGKDFQPNFTARVMVGSSTYPIYSGAQTVFVNSNRVLLWVLIGGAASQPYSLEIVNPDNQASNIFSGLFASNGQQGGNQGNTQLDITFQPNPVGPASTSNCNRAYVFTVNVQNTGTNAVTFSRLDIDSFQSVALSQVGFPNQIGPSSAFQSGISYCRGSGSSTWTLYSNTGAAWSGTVQLQ